MNKNIISPNSVATELSIQQLEQSEYLVGTMEYSKVLQNNQGTLTQAYGNDVNSIFLMAQQNLEPNEEQLCILNGLKNDFIYVEKQIDPERFKFTITKATDNEICINRKAINGGRVKIIINDDGVIAFSFLPDKENAEKEELYFCTLNDETDFQKMVFKFLSC